MEEILVHQPKGHPDAPLSDAELLAKMEWLLEGVAPTHTAKRLLELCARLSTAEDVEKLIETCRVRSR
jgi:2-methylcitrate dehydratase PrpD